MENTIKQNIAKTKSLLCGLQDVKKSFETVSSNIKQEVEHIKDMQANDIPVIPEIDYKSILNGSVSISQIAEIKRRGSLIIRGVFDEQLAREWNEEIVEYILRNDYYTKSIEKEGMDQYFSQLKSGAPQIFGIYWSKPQMLARQSKSMANTKKFLNSLWDVSEKRKKLKRFRQHFEGNP